MARCVNCVHGYLGTEEIHDYGAPVTPARIGSWLELMARLGQPTRIRLCKCQTDPHGEAEHERRMRKAWRMEDGS